MMAMLNKYKLWVLLVGIIVAAGVWFGLSSSSGPSTILSTTSVHGEGEADQDLVNTLLQLRAVSLNGAVFTNIAFMGLQDFSTHIVAEPVGRDDPFAPIAGSFSSIPQSASSTHAAQMFSGTSTPSGAPSSTLPRAPRR